MCSFCRLKFHRPVETNHVWGFQPKTSVVISFKLNFYYLVIKVPAMAKPDGFLLTLQLLLFFMVLVKIEPKEAVSFIKLRQSFPHSWDVGGNEEGCRAAGTQLKSFYVICVWLLVCVISQLILHNLRIYLNNDHKGGLNTLSRCSKKVLGLNPYLGSFCTEPTCSTHACFGSLNPLISVLARSSQPLCLCIKLAL